MENLRNVGLIAHIDAGKTTVSERFLYLAGKVHQIGETHEGAATMDYMEEEQDRGITITSAATQFDWKDTKVNLIDTPGHVDFTVEVERSLRVLDGAVGIFCAVNGVEPQSETVWKQSETYRVPRLAFVNKMDREGADYNNVLEEMQDQLGTQPIALYWPLDSGDEFSTVLDIINEQVLELPDEPAEAPEVIQDSVPEEHQDLLERERERMIEAAADADDEVFERVIEEKEIPDEMLQNALKQGTLDREICPVLCGSALNNQGIHYLLDAVTTYLPNPHESTGIEGNDPTTKPPEPMDVSPNPDDPFAAYAFKSHSSTTGDLTFIRIYSGSIETGDVVWNPRTDSDERIGRLYVLHAGKKESVKKASAGDIVGAVGMKDTATGDTLCDPDRPVVFESMNVPEAVISLAVAPAHRKDQDKLSRLLASVAREDPSFHYETDPETNEIIIKGMGELHLNVVLDRITEEHGIKIERSAPIVSYRKTLRSPTDVKIKHVKQTGGQGQYAVCEMRFEPANLEGKIEFEDEIRGGAIPKEYIPGVEEGIRKWAEEGGQDDIPLVNVRAVLEDGDSHPVDSSEMAFQTAGEKAIREAVERSGVVLLEPIMDLEIRIPEDETGNVINDLNTRRASVGELDTRANERIINAEVPLAEMFQYATTLRSITQGRGTHMMEFKHYAPVPEQIARKIMKEIRSDD